MWTEASLADLLEVVIDHRGKTPKKLGGKDFSDAGVPVVSAIHIKGGRIEWTERERYVPRWMFEKWMPTRLQEGDVLLTSEAPLGEVAQVPTNDDLVLSQRLFALRGKPGVMDSSFLRYYFETPTGRSRLEARASGTTVLGIRQAELLKVQVPVPPIAEQRLIAGALRSFDNLIEHNRRLTAAMREVARSHFEREVAQGEEVAFGAVARLVRDGVSAARLTSGTPYLGLEHFETGGGGITTVGDAGSLDSNKSRFHAGDVLYGKLRPYFRKHDRPGFSGVCSTEIWVLRPNEGFGAATVDALVSRAEFTDFAMLGSGGTRMPRADWNHVATMPVRVPSAATRAETEATLDELWRARVALAEEIDDLARTRSELLPLLVSGRVRVRDLEGLVA